MIHDTHKAAGPPLFDAKAILGILCIGHGILPRRNDLYEAGNALMEYMLPPGPEKNELTSEQNAQIAYSALSHSNPELKELLLLTSQLINKRLAQATDSHDMSRTDEIIDTALSRRKSLRVNAPRLNIKAYNRISEEMAFAAQEKSFPPMDALISMMHFAGIDTATFEIKHPRIGSAVVAQVTVGDKDKETILDLLKQHHLKYTRHDETPEPGKITLTVSLNPLIRDQSRAVRIEQALQGPARTI